MREKIRIKKSGGYKYKIKVRYLIIALALCGVPTFSQNIAQAEGCPDLRVIYVRGSGAPAEGDGNYLEYKRTIEEKLATTSLKYDFFNVDYPAIAVNDLGVLIGAAISAGESGALADSVKIGVDHLAEVVKNSSCSNTKYVIGGYSQGAMVILKTMDQFNPDNIIFIATFGDPKIYLPEGKGILPAACRGENLSNYRMYVPDCRAYMGILGGHVPYQPEAYIDKMGTWCNKGDILCSHMFSISDHVSYAEDGIYEDASRVIFNKVTAYFNIENHLTSPHDTAILIDSTGSMSSMIDQYKEEALRLARETLDSGGRVALYDYRDLDDPYEPVKHCDFDTCTLEIFINELNTINADGGGDTPESLLSSSFHMMKELNWKRGSTKSVVVLTDADFLSPDRDGISFDEVVSLSKKIDPVNFYIITADELIEDYQALADATDGRVVGIGELNLVTDYIMSRSDSLPRVEEEYDFELPVITEWSAVKIAETEVNINFKTTGSQTMIAVGDAILGTTNETEITIFDYTGGDILLIPIQDNVRGDAVKVEVQGFDEDIFVPLAPNTGRV